MKRRVLLLVLSLALLTGRVSADTITLQDGSVIDNVKITAETWEKIDYKKPKVPAPQSVKSADVKSVEYGQTSADYREGQNQAKEGNIPEATQYFDAVASDTSIPAFVRADARIRQADLLLSIGQIPAAVTAYDGLLAEFPDTRHLARALLGKGRALFFQKQNDAAAAAFDKLKAEVAAKNLGAQWELLAEFNALLVLEVQGKTADAAKGYEALRARAVGHQDIASQCLLGLGRSHLANGEADKALPLFEEIIDARADADRDVAAAAFNGRGRVSFARGQAALDNAARAGAKGDKAKAGLEREKALEAFNDARLDFLRVVVSYPEVVAQQPEALYYAGQSFLNIGDDEAAARAGSLLKRCAQKYPESSWGKKAAQS